MVESLSDRLCVSFHVVNNHKDQITANISLHPNDFEDFLQYQSALEVKCDCIISRNVKDFGFSKIPVVSALDFLRLYF